MELERERRKRAETTLWHALGTLYSQRRLIAGVTVTVAVLSVIISLLLPVWFQATTRLLLPEGSGGSGLSAVLDEFSPAAAALLGSGGGDTNRYFSILSSRRVMDRVVETFELETEYETTDGDTPRSSAIEMLRDNVTFVIDDEFEFLAIEVFDRDPQRAAKMANFFVAELNRVNSELLSQNAANYRRFMSTSLQDTEASMDSALARMQRFQEEHGVIDLPTQTQTFLESIAGLRAQVLQAEIRADVLERQFGPNNAQVRAARDAVDVAEAQYRAALEGSERLLPIPQSDVPELARQYAKLKQEILIQGEILKFVRPLYEQARFDEQREKMAVQVLDPAVAPEKKAKPKRSIIVILATASGFLLALIYVLLADAFRRHHRQLLNRLQTAAASVAPAPDEE
jgi:uncharacterized protein involved in exopolysaccharide biosynthesis